MPTIKLPAHVDLAAALDALSRLGCSDGHCWFIGRATGMHTNGGCHCLEGISDRQVRRALQAVLEAARETAAEEKRRMGGGGGGQ